MRLDELLIKRIDDEDDLPETGLILQEVEVHFPNHDYWIRKVVLPEIKAGIKNAWGIYVSYKPKIFVPSDTEVDLFRHLCRRKTSIEQNEILRNVVEKRRKVMVGLVIYQDHKKDDTLIELKHLRLTPDAMRLGIGSTSLKIVENDLKNHQRAVVGDVGVERTDAVQFMICKGYDISGPKDLYGDGNSHYNLYKSA